MKKRIVFPIVALFFAIVVSFNVRTNFVEGKTLDLNLANVEALASIESGLGPDGWSCFLFFTTDYLSPVWFSVITCGGCNYQAFVIDARWSDTCSML